MKHVCIVGGTHLWLTPRVVKEADALSAAGFRVTVVGPTTVEADYRRDRAILEGRAWERISAPDLLKPGGSAKRLISRLSRRLQMIAVRRLRLPLAGALGYGIRETMAAAIAANADIYSCHLEVGLLTFRRLKKMGRRCAIDLEDWHSRDLLGQARLERPIGLIEGLERQALNEADFTMTTSEALADAFVAAYGGVRPIVVYNAFERTGDSRPDRLEDRRSLERPSLHWYSQNVGPGRGLELLFDAVDRLDRDFELHIRGRGPQSYKDQLLSRVTPATAGKVFFHAVVDNAELPARIAEHDIGLALEMRSPPSRDLTITNKVFQYLQGGCAVIATRTSGQEEAARLYPGAIILSDDTPEALAQAIAGLLTSPERLVAAQAAARAAADGPASWEQASKVLVRRFLQAVGQSYADQGGVS